MLRSMSPAAEVRATLAELRKRGVPFTKAWPMAIQRIRAPESDPTAGEVRDWKLAIRWAEPHFAAAYTRSESPMPETISLADAEQLVA